MFYHYLKSASFFVLSLSLLAVPVIILILASLKEPTEEASEPNYACTYQIEVESNNNTQSITIRVCIDLQDK